MKYATEFNETNCICTIRVTGEFLRPDDSLFLRQLLYDLAAERSYRLFLFDMTKAEIKGKWTEVVPAITGHQDPGHKMGKVKAAVVYSSNLSDNKLLETIASTKGHLMTVFGDIDQATEWLQI